MKNTIIFDLDNTLCACYIYYDAIIDQFCQKMSELHNIKPDLVKNMEYAIDNACHQLPGGFKRERFPNSLGATSVALDVIFGKFPDNIRRQQMVELGNSVFNEPYDLFPDTIKVLKKYQKAGYKLILWTKGDQKIQRRKIEINKLDKIFGKYIEITPSKTPETLQEMMLKFNIKEKNTWLVGDSLKGDIDSGNSCHLQTVWIKGATKDWEAVQKNGIIPTETIDSISELPDVIPITIKRRKGK